MTSLPAILMEYGKPGESGLNAHERAGVVPRLECENVMDHMALGHHAQDQQLTGRTVVLDRVLRVRQRKIYNLPGKDAQVCLWIGICIKLNYPHVEVQPANRCDDSCHSCCCTNKFKLSDFLHRNYFNNT